MIDRLLASSSPIALVADAPKPWKHVDRIGKVEYGKPSGIIAGRVEDGYGYVSAAGEKMLFVVMKPFPPIEFSRIDDPEEWYIRTNPEAAR